MIDIVTDFETKAESLGMVFDYGTRAMNNLLDADEKTDDIHFLLSSPTTWEPEPSSPFGGAGKQTLSGGFLLVVKSDLDNVIHGQRGNDKETGKYKKNIVPLMTKLDAFKALIDCSDYIVEQWKAIDAYNVLDTNTDGFLVTFKLKEA